MKHALPGFALLAACTAAQAGNSAVDQARADCAANKMKVRALEARMAPDQELTAARKAWEASCLHAQKAMMSAANTPPASPALAAPAPRLTIVEPAPAAPAAQCVPAAPAAPATPEMPAMPEAPPAS